MRPALLLLLLGLAGLAAGKGIATFASGREVLTARYAEGGVKSQVAYVNGVRQGDATFWYPDGRVMARGSFERDRREGPWEWFREDGGADPARTGVYREGRRVAE